MYLLHRTALTWHLPSKLTCHMSFWHPRCKCNILMRKHSMPQHEDNFEPGNSSEHGTCSTMQHMQCKSNAKIALRYLFGFIDVVEWFASAHALATFGCKKIRHSCVPRLSSNSLQSLQEYSVLEKESIREIKSLKMSFVCNGLPAVLKRLLCCQVCIKEKHKEGLPACRTTSRRADRQLRPLIAEMRWSQ